MKRPRPPTHEAPRRAATFDLEERLEKVEDMLCAGIAPGRIERLLSTEYGVTSRQVRTYIGRIYARWREQSIQDAPHRREKLIRMAERFFSKALAEKQYSAASTSLTLLGRMSGAFVQHDPAREQRIAAIPPPPDDPAQALIWTQRALLMGLDEVLRNPSLDPERRLRWIAELGGKLGMCHSKTIVEAKLETVAGRLLGAGEREQAETESTAGIAFPATSRFGASSSAPASE